MTSIRRRSSRPYDPSEISNSGGSRSAGSTVPGSRVPGVPTNRNGQQQNNIDASFSDILGRTTNNGNSNNDILNFLNGLGIDQNKGLTGSQRDDWNKQLLDTLINYLLTQENRSYNESMRDEQRLYDSPTNQLARLMGAGISRDAAIQMLSGGSQPIQSEASTAAEGIAPSESKMNGINAALAPIQTAFDAVSAVGSLVGLGFSIPQAIQQTKMLKNQNLLTKQQLQSYETASSAFRVLNGIGADADAFGSVGNAIKAIQSAADGGNVQAKQYIADGGLDALKNNEYWNSQALSHLYRSERDSESFGKFVEKQDAENAILKVNKNAATVGILKMWSEIENIKQNTDFQEAQTGMISYQINVLEKQAALLEKQGNKTDAESLLIKAQELRTKQETRSLMLSNNIEEDAQNALLFDSNGDLVTGQFVMSRSKAYQAIVDMEKFSRIKDEKLWDKELSTIAMNYDQLYSLYALNYAFNSGALAMFEQNEDYADLWSACQAFNTCGGWNYINTAFSAGKAPFGINNSITRKHVLSEITGKPISFDK